MTGALPWPLAAILSPEADLCTEVQAAVADGFTRVELSALADRPREHLEALADSGVLVACADLGVGLAAESLPDRRSRLEQLRLQVADAARLGATVAFVTAPTDVTAEARAYFREGCGLLARHACARMVRLAVRALPGTLLPDVPSALLWLADAGLAEVGLAVDVESDPECLLLAGERLAHVRLPGGLPGPALEAALRGLCYLGVLAVARRNLTGPSSDGMIADV